MAYFTWKEDEAYREGRRDEQYGRNNYEYDEHFGGDTDKRIMMADVMKNVNRTGEKKCMKKNEGRKKENSEGN